jgi:hypothetical protein
VFEPAEGQALRAIVADRWPSVLTTEVESVVSPDAITASGP